MVATAPPATPKQHLWAPRHPCARLGLQRPRAGLRLAPTHHTGHPELASLHPRGGRALTGQVGMAAKCWRWERVTQKAPSTPKREGGTEDRRRGGGGWSSSLARATEQRRPAPIQLITCFISTLITQGNTLIKEKGFSLSFSLLSRVSCANPAPGKVTF